MEFSDSPEETAFRADVRRFIADNLPAGWERSDDDNAMVEPADPERRAFLLRWRRALGERGWIAPHWPREYGGGGMTQAEQFIFNEETAEARAPDVGGFGVTMIGPTPNPEL
jgi:alkylation response protein AidB-like acyl-CoA dehydrogenase